MCSEDFHTEYGTPSGPGLDCIGSRFNWALTSSGTTGKVRSSGSKLCSGWGGIGRCWRLVVHRGWGCRKMHLQILKEDLASGAVVLTQYGSDTAFSIGSVPSLEFSCLLSSCTPGRSLVLTTSGGGGSPLLDGARGSPLLGRGRGSPSWLVRSLLCGGLRAWIPGLIWASPLSLLPI